MNKGKVNPLRWVLVAIVLAAAVLYAAYSFLIEKRVSDSGLYNENSMAGEESQMNQNKNADISLKSNAAITQEDMIYFVFTDRFNNGDKSNDIEAKYDDPYGYHGGDFQGIIDKLDYIRDLGFTAIWISPVVKNDPDSYHGYLGIDFYETNPNFGSMEKLKELVQKAHAKGIKVILDFVVNHTGRTHPWASDPKYYNWFHHEGRITDWNDQTNVENGEQDGLPDFNQDNPETRKYLLDMTKWWIEQTEVDGFRLDTFRHVPVSFWTEFISLTKSTRPGFYSVGEVFDGPVFQLADYQTSTGADGMLDYPVYSAVKQVFGQPESSAATLGDVITQSFGTYDNAHLMGTFIDNHDVPRFINALQFTSEKDRIAKLNQALTFMMTYTGIPILYYGTEIAMDGGPDPDNRHDMDWNAKSTVMDYVKKLAGIRKNNPALTHGDIKVLRAENDFLCYERNYEGQKIVVAFNNTKNKVSYDVRLAENALGNEKEADKQYNDLLGGYRLDVEDGLAAISLEPYQSIIISVGR